MGKNDKHRDIEKIALKMSIAYLIFGICIGLFSGLGVVILSLEGHVCGDVAMDSDDFLRLIEKAYPKPDNWVNVTISEQKALIGYLYCSENRSCVFVDKVLEGYNGLLDK